MDDCIFCRIARGTMDARVVYGDEHVIAFDDIMPQAPVHTLVIPRAHFRHLGDSVPGELMSRLWVAVAKVAEIKGVSESGYRAIVNNGREAGQSVGHLHVHVLGGGQMSHGMVRLQPRPGESRE